VVTLAAGAGNQATVARAAFGNGPASRAIGKDSVPAALHIAKTRQHQRADAHIHAGQMTERNSRKVQERCQHGEAEWGAMSLQMRRRSRGFIDWETPMAKCSERSTSSRFRRTMLTSFAACPMRRSRR